MNHLLSDTSSLPGAICYLKGRFWCLDGRREAPLQASALSYECIAGGN